MAIRGPLSLKARAIGLLAQREHSRTELRRKLLRIEQQRERLAAARTATTRVSTSGCELDDAVAALPDEPLVDECELGTTHAEAVDALLDTLAADGYLDETRFIESRLHLRARRFGVQRIQQELAQHGLRMDADQQAELRTTELARAREVWLRRFGPEPAAEPAEQARQTRFLMARGFAADVVRRLLRAKG